MSVQSYSWSPLVFMFFNKINCDTIEASKTQLSFIGRGPLSTLVNHAWVCDGIPENASQVPSDYFSDGILLVCGHLQVQGSNELD